MMVIDMKGPGVEVRPLRQITGGSDFNECSFTDVFVPDADVVATGSGWRVARPRSATSASASVAGVGTEIDDVYSLSQAAGTASGWPPARRPPPSPGRRRLRLLNLRRAERRRSPDGEPGAGSNSPSWSSPDGHAAAACCPTSPGTRPPSPRGSRHRRADDAGTRGMSIAAGPPRSPRNQIASDPVGLPRDPLIK